MSFLWIDEAFDLLLRYVFRGYSELCLFWQLRGSSRWQSPRVHLKLFCEGRTCRAQLNSRRFRSFPFLGHARACLASLTRMDIPREWCMSQFVFLILKESLDVSFIHILVVWNCRHRRCSHLFIRGLLTWLLDAHSWVLWGFAYIWSKFCLVSYFWLLSDCKLNVFRIIQLKCLIHVDSSTDHSFVREPRPLSGSHALILDGRSNSLRPGHGPLIIFAWISTLGMNHGLAWPLMNILESQRSGWKIHLRVSPFGNTGLPRGHWWRDVSAFVQNGVDPWNAKLVVAPRRIPVFSVVEPNIVPLLEFLVLSLMFQ